MLETLPELNVTADLQLARAPGDTLAEGQTREYRHVAAQGDVRRRTVRRTNTETGGGGKQEKLNVAVVGSCSRRRSTSSSPGVVTGQTQADALVVELTQPRKRVRVESQQAIDRVFQYGGHEGGYVH